MYNKEYNMKGSEEYKQNFLILIRKRIEDNPDIPYLNEFQIELLSKKANDWSGKYNYLMRVINFMKSIGKDPKDLRHIDFINYLAKMTEEGYSDSYRIVTYAALKQWCKCLEMNCLGYDKAQSLTKDDTPKRDHTHKSVAEIKKQKEGYLTEEEIQILLKNIEDGVGSHKARMRQKNTKERDEAIIRIFLSTGIRCASLYQLDVENIDWDNRILYFMNKGGQYKTAYLSENTIQSLKAWIDKRQEIIDSIEDESERKELEAPLFISDRKKRMCRAAIANVVKRFGNDINGKQMSPHKLRHTFGTNLYKETGDIYWVSDALCHRNVNTTRIYINDLEEKRQKTAEIMNAMI